MQHWKFMPSGSGLRLPARAAWLIVAALPFAHAVFAAELELPLALDYRILEQALDQQLFTGPDQSVEVYTDRIRCNTMVLSEPRIEATDSGQFRILTTIKTHTGTPLGRRCVLANTWIGVIETVHESFVNAEQMTVGFSVVDSNILRRDEQKPAVPRIVRKWITEYLHPRLDAVRIDLQPAVSGIQELVGHAFAGPETEIAAMVASLRLKAARPSATGLDIVLSLEVPAAPPTAPPVEESPLSEEELARWDDNWQAWDGFATWMFKTTAAASPELADALADTLLEARYELRDALAIEDRKRDPVRELFLHTWERLAPLLQETQPDLPGARAFSYATFIAAADALEALDRVAPYLGMQLDKYSLRSLARLLVPSVDDPELAYDAAVDPSLRRLLGLEPAFDVGNDPVTSFILDWLIRSTEAAELNADLVNQLNGWVPGPGDVDKYLRMMVQLMDDISKAERDRDKVPGEFFGIYETLLRATAWQESCWRQYIETAGTIQPIQSSAGSIGLMQVNRHVWRGVYDIEALTNDIAYNARAGNEILVHYLVDYAIRKREHEITGNADNLARATYAIYNGGPSHLRRYRNPDNRASLKKIDKAFWEKYLAIQREGPNAVRQCYGH